MIVERSNLWVSRDISILLVFIRQFKSERKLVHFLGKNTHKNFLYYWHLH